MFPDPELHYRIARRKQQEAQARARLRQELRDAGVISGTRAASVALLRWLADRVDSAPVHAPHSRGSYGPNA